VKPAVFDLVLSLAIAAYIGAVYLAIKVRCHMKSHTCTFYNSLITAKIIKYSRILSRISPQSTKPSPSNFLAVQIKPTTTLPLPMGLPINQNRRKLKWLIVFVHKDS